MHVHDLELARRCAGGDEAAWSQLARAVATAATLAVTRVVGTRRRADDPALEDEIASDTLVALAAGSARLLRVYRGDAPIEAFLAALASTRAQHALRARSRREAALARCASLERRGQRPTETWPAGMALEHDELARAVGRGLDDLAAGDRLLLVLFYFDGHSYKDIARATGLALTGVGAKIARARARLAQILDRQGFEDPRAGPSRGAPGQAPRWGA